MLGKLTTALSSLTTTTTTVPAVLSASHHAPDRVAHNASIATTLSIANIPVSYSDCYSCENPCDVADSSATGRGQVVEAGVAYGGKSYEDYVEEKYGDLGELPKGFDVDWESDLAGSAKGGRGRVVVVSTGKSDWVRDHTVNSSLQCGHVTSAVYCS
jgi:hypothetical protein